MCSQTVHYFYLHISPNKQQQKKIFYKTFQKKKKNQEVLQKLSGLCNLNFS